MQMNGFAPFIRFAHGEHPSAATAVMTQQTCLLMSNHLQLSAFRTVSE